MFSHDVMAAVFVSQNSETAAMFASQTSPVRVELFSYVNAFFCSNKFGWPREWKNRINYCYPRIAKLGSKGAMEIRELNECLSRTKKT